MSKTDEKPAEAEADAQPKGEVESKAEDAKEAKSEAPAPKADAAEAAEADEAKGSASDDKGGEEAKAEAGGQDAPAEGNGEAAEQSDTAAKPRRTRARRSRTRRKPRNNNAKRDDKPSADETADKPSDRLKATALWGLHKERRAKMVAFAGYDMPVQYKRGIMSEHRHTRDRAGLFDVSHMGQAFLTLEGEGGHEDIAALVEELVPGNIKGLKPGGIRYTLLLNEEGGIKDDLMVTRPEGEAGEGMLFLVVNAGCKDKDFAYITEKLEGRAKLTIAGDRALVALQGPEASNVLSRHAPFVAEMPFMTALSCRIDGMECIVSRCGYTGEDGYEISVPNEMAESFARKLLAHREVVLAGLGARDSLRLEAGLCLYGCEITEETSPAEADLLWTIPKRRKEAKDFPGAERIMSQIEEGVARRRVGIQPEGKAPARDGTEIVDADGTVIGRVTSGGFGPSVRGPVAMGYVDAAHSEAGTEIFLMVRGQPRAAHVAALPFVEPRQFRPDSAKPKKPQKTRKTRKAKETPPPAEDVAEDAAIEPIEEPIEEVAKEETGSETEGVAADQETSEAAPESEVKSEADDQPVESIEEQEEDGNERS